LPQCDAHSRLWWLTLQITETNPFSFGLDERRLKEFLEHMHANMLCLNKSIYFFFYFFMSSLKIVPKNFPSLLFFINRFNDSINMIYCVIFFIHPTTSFRTRENLVDNLWCVLLLEMTKYQRKFYFITR